VLSDDKESPMARQSYSKEFKARVALDALKGQKTVSEIASEYKIHPNQVSTWKKSRKRVRLDFYLLGRLLYVTTNINSK